MKQARYGTRSAAVGASRDCVPSGKPPDLSAKPMRFHEERVDERRNYHKCVDFEK
eukprot:CAMPEP_0184660970 /NCGR_PEP_ID=MMETSP0308-20130426/36351_1 /TAXON_ID=38269 /ORGANISM="Gloeochaete witrockiana, Strain SAG 46.84" /LENGTH=54 /DNA_ID=CAMNT_0027101943 /DNA_START=33 /DNA_END=194 /DNA_ORIENTATION=+